MKLNKIKFRSFIEDLSDQDIFKCLALIIIIILEKYSEPVPPMRDLKSWCGNMTSKANRHIIKVQKKAGKCLV